MMKIVPGELFHLWQQNHTSFTEDNMKSNTFLPVLKKSSSPKVMPTDSSCASEVESPNKRWNYSPKIYLDSPTLPPTIQRTQKKSQRASTSLRKLLVITKFLVVCSYVRIK